MPCSINLQPFDNQKIPTEGAQQDLSQKADQTLSVLIRSNHISANNTESSYQENGSRQKN